MAPVCVFIHVLYPPTLCRASAHLRPGPSLISLAWYREPVSNELEVLLASWRRLSGNSRAWIPEFGTSTWTPLQSPLNKTTHPAALNHVHRELIKLAVDQRNRGRSRLQVRNLRSTNSKWMINRIIFSRWMFQHRAVEVSWFVLSYPSLNTIFLL